jgi:N-acetylglucosaminyl-diphospho-decaprenol L-rhamnosyltransferase
MSLHVAVVIVGYNNPDDISRCVASLEKSSYGDFEIVICENGSDVTYAALQSEIPIVLRGGQRVKLVKAPGNGGYSSGINIAMAQSKEAEAWWILNPDTEASPNAMAALVDCILQGHDAAGGPIHFPGGEIQSFGGEWLVWQAKAVSLGYGMPKDTKPHSADIERKQNFLSGASMFVSREFVKITGPMAEHFFLYCEEAEWFLRSASHGMRLGFAPDAVVVHHQGTTTGYSKSLRSRSALSVFLDERNKMVLTRDLYPARLPVVAVLALCRLMVRYGREGAFRQIGWGMSGWFMGLYGQTGVPGRCARDD